MSAATKVVWQAQPGPQTALIECPVFEVFFGGARGGGKTEGSLGDWIEHLDTWGGDVNGAFFRRNRSDLVDVIARSRQIFPYLGGKFNENKSTWTWPNGARLAFEFLDRDVDAQKYQGRSYTRIYIEEATQFPSPSPIMKLKATLRSAAGVPCGLRLTGNPGGPGHNWVKARYIDPAPGGNRILTEEEELEIDGKKVKVAISRVFIPSRIADNQLLLRNDPTYILRLRDVGNEALVKAWLDGDWTIIDGAFFSEWSSKHILPTYEWLEVLPKRATRFTALDWGTAKPFSVGWWIVSDGTWGLPKQALLRYREWYGMKSPNVGLKMDAKAVAEGIREREEHAKDVITYRVADPAIFIYGGGPTIAELMALKGVMWRRADNKRVPGWVQLRSRLVGEGGVPMVYFLDCCADAIRTIPLLQHDETNPEDVDTEGEDHAGDEVRYAVMSRPWVTNEGDAPTPDLGLPVPGKITFLGALNLIRQRRLNTEHRHG